MKLSHGRWPRAFSDSEVTFCAVDDFLSKHKRPAAQANPESLGPGNPNPKTKGFLLGFRVLVRGRLDGLAENQLEKE